MRRNVKPQAVGTRTAARQTASTANAAARRAFPAWIDAADGAAFSVTSVTPRLRSALVLRVVTPQKPANPRNAAHGSGAR
jgi:hypothetical protein